MIIAHYLSSFWCTERGKFSTQTRTIGQNKTVYRRATGSSTIGTVFASDSVMIIGNNGSRTQIIYNISNGYKMGWINGVYTIPSSTVKTALTSSDIKTLTFNSIYYANKYADLKAAFGYDESQLYNHWINHGISEGRSGSPILNLHYYLENNADLKNAFGSNNFSAAYNHFITFGWKENRISSEYYSGNLYKNKYSDLSHMSSFDLMIHYLNFGINEKRIGNSSNLLPNMSKNIPTTNSSSWQWPMTNAYVCGNNWSTYYAVKGKDHLGLDIASSTGNNNVYAAANGTVVLTGYNSANGNSIVIKHNVNGQTVYSFYGHLNSINITKTQPLLKVKR